MLFQNTRNQCMDKTTLLRGLVSFRRCPALVLYLHGDTWSCVFKSTCVVRFEKHDFAQKLKTLCIGKCYVNHHNINLPLHLTKHASLRFSPVIWLWFSSCRSSLRETVGSMLKPPKDTVSLPSRGPRGRMRGSIPLWFVILLGRTLQISM